jgi:hypothetical protein
MAQTAVQGVGVGHLLLDEVIVERLGRNVEPAAGDDSPAVDRIAAVIVAQRHELVVALELGHRQRARQRHRVEGVLERLLQRRDQRRQLSPGGRAVEARSAG